MKMRNAICFITLVWSIGMLAGAYAHPGKSNGLGDDFSSQMLAGAIAWLALIFDHPTPVSIFVGISMLIGPFWGLVALKDFGQKNAGLCAICFSGMASSIVAYGTPKIYPAILGGVCAPLALALFLTGFALQQAKEAAQAAAGNETDSQKRIREESERRRAG
jgi:hypothetical protein